MTNLVQDIWTLVMKPTGPRRQRSSQMEEELSQARSENISAVKRNREAVRDLIDQTMSRLEGSNDQIDAGD